MSRGMTRRSNAPPNGQIRHSQIVTTFGPGSLVDLPRTSVLIGGLDHWMGLGEEIHEPRLIEKLRRHLDLPELKLFTPPPASDDPGAPRTGITAWQFPEWFVTQDVLSSDDAIRSRALIHRRALVKGAYLGADRKGHPIVPVRFVRACRCGHIGDIDWRGFVHQGTRNCSRQLWLDERGTTGDINDIVIRCECKMQRPLVHATQRERRSLGMCDGARPWLGPDSRTDCQEVNRLLVRAASNSYFSRVMSVISLPDRDESLEKVVSQVWQFLDYAENIEDVRNERRRAVVKAALDGFSDDEVLRTVQARKGTGGEPPPKKVKEAEIEVLASCKDEIGEDKPDGDFYARNLPRSEWAGALTECLESVVLVHRLREVAALVEFTRFDPATPDIDGELEAGAQAAPLAREATWLPAVENRGEGVFLGFKRSAIEEWLARPEVQQRGLRLLAGFRKWQEEHPESERKFLALPYIMLHSLSHLLITALALECGYPASSIRERVYAGEAGYGILLYTGSSDAEGTLGGLVEAGREIDRHLQAAVEMGGLCSNDPVCAQHDPPNPHERRYLVGAACHGCVLIAETSCEQYNDFLDRAMVVPTVENLGAEFFRRQSK
jgi:hypothetical protein